MGDASLSSLLNSPVSFYTPEVMAGGPVPEGTHFVLYDTRAAAIAAADGPHLTYLTYFPGPLHGLSVGTPVQMKGVQVGRVREVHLRYVPESATLITPVTLEIDPRQLEFPVTDAMTRVELRSNFNDAMQKLVRKGMRATLATSLVLPGASAVALEMVGAPNTASLGLNSDPPIIPAANAGGGIEGTLSSINAVAETIRNLPLREIAADLRSTTRRVNALVSDPALDQSLQSLNRSLSQIEQVAKITRENIGPITDSLRNAATSAESASKRVEQLMGSSARQNYDLGELVKELTRAAEAVRALASYLNENPDALLKGRNK
jgi:paraquat-inducible protein B